ncbi:MAG: hypothetical protein NXH73_01370 [Flavobacteriaceae bacterium]|nr:hypothetical protein [Flavobacteriaceae bacterium]
MKKLILSIAAVAVFAFTSCSSDDDGGKSCEQLATEISTTGQAFVEDQTQANCNAYRVALEAYIDKNCEEAASFEGLLDLLDCNSL